MHSTRIDISLRSMCCRRPTRSDRMVGFTSTPFDKGYEDQRKFPRADVAAFLCDIMPMVMECEQVKPLGLFSPSIEHCKPFGEGAPCAKVTRHATSFAACHSVSLPVSPCLIWNKMVLSRDTGASSGRHFGKHPLRTSVHHGRPPAADRHGNILCARAVEGVASVNTNANVALARSVEGSRSVTQANTPHVQECEGSQICERKQTPTQSVQGQWREPDL